jgi:hypothetical protein
MKFEIRDGALWAREGGRWRRVADPVVPLAVVRDPQGHRFALDVRLYPANAQPIEARLYAHDLWSAQDEPLTQFCAWHAIRVYRAKTLLNFLRRAFPGEPRIVDRGWPAWDWHDECADKSMKRAFEQSRAREQHERGESALDRA